MTPSDIATIRADFAIVAAAADAFAAEFYDTLFDLDPTLRALFPSDLTAQQGRLTQVLAMVIAGLDRLDTIVPAVCALGRRHDGYGILPRDHATVGEALLATLEARLPVFDEPRRLAWVRAYATLADVMTEARRDSAA